jgi:hypothetical protein
MIETALENRGSRAVNLSRVAEFKGQYGFTHNHHL